jgi:hypothetical protein
MTALAFAFAGSLPARLHFAWPVTAAPHGVLRNPRYRWVPPQPAIVPRLCGGRFVVPFVPFPGFLPPANVRAGLAASGQRAATVAAVEPTIAWNQSNPAWATPALPARDAARMARELRIPARNSAPAWIDTRSVWGEGGGRATDLRAALRRIPPRGADLRTVGRDGGRRARAVGLAFVRAWVRTAERRAPWNEAAVGGSPFGQDWRSAPPVGLLARFPWRGALRCGGLAWPWPPLPPLPPIPPRLALRFHFHAPARGRLTFRFGREPSWLVPIQRSYRMQHVFDLVRLPEETSIPVSAVTLQCDWEEWAWSLTATLAGPAAVALLRPVVSQAVEVEVRLDGYAWQFRLDTVSGSESFNATGGQTQGIGRAALLGPGVALPANGYEEQAKTARQLAEQELIGTVWQLDWPPNFADWLVPAKRFSYSQQTPIEVISRLIATAGGRVLAVKKGEIIEVRPRYPLPPWEWATAEPDLMLPRSILKTLAWKPRVGQPWDAVYLGDGETVLAKVQRAGLPGASLPDAPIVEALLCHLDACRARGLALLSDAVAGVDFTLALPLSAAAGISPLRAVGELVRFEDGGKIWAGSITSVSINIGFGTATQTLEVRAVEVPA